MGLTVYNTKASCGCFLFLGSSKVTCEIMLHPQSVEIMLHPQSVDREQQLYSVKSLGLSGQHLNVLVK